LRAVDFTDDQAQRPTAMVDALMAFARAQQAKAFKEAVQACDARRLHYVATREVDTLVRGIQINEASGCIAAIQAQATAREQT